jgi:hypothetical protein
VGFLRCGAVGGFIGPGRRVLATVFDCIKLFYNSKRRHGHGSSLSPMLFEQLQQISSS